MIHDACTFHTSSPFLGESSNGIVGGIHTCTLYTQLHGLHVLLLVYLQKNFISAQPHKSICAEMKIQSSTFKLGTPIYIPKHISQHPTLLGYIHIYINMYTWLHLLPTIKYLHIYICETCKYSSHHS